MEKKRFIWGFGVIFAGALTALSAGCSGSGKEEPASSGKPEPGTEAKEAMANIEEKSGSTVRGMADFKAEGENVTLTLTISGATPGPHGVHIHEFGDCSASDASSAGGHWNPLNKKHGRWGSDQSHLGDIGNLTVDQTGKGTLTLSTNRWAIGTGGANDIVGKSVVVHANADDFMTQPDGAAGQRVGCGTIQKQ